MIRFRIVSVCSLVAALIGSQLNAQLIYEETFRNTDAPGWVFAQGDTAPGPRLTAGSTPVAADPETVNEPIDPAGQGWLRMTTRRDNQANSAYLNLAIPADGTAVTFEFDFAFWSTNTAEPADGITVFLADPNVSFNPGSFGGSLGYANRTGDDGLTGGMVGVGYDVWGNYSNSAEGRNGGFNDTNLRKNNIVVRGQGSGQNGYYYVGGTTDAAGGLSGMIPGSNDNLDFASQDFRPDQDAAQYRRTRVTIDADNKVSVWIEFGYGTGYVKVIDQIDLEAVTGWVGRPEELILGFTGGTGGADQIYEVRNLQIALEGGTDSYYWDNQVGNLAWQSGTNWDKDTVPSTGANVFFTDAFDDTDGPQTVQLNGERTIGSAYFGGQHSYELESGTLVFDAASSLNTSRIHIVNTPTGAADHTIEADVRLENDLEIRHFTTTDFTISGDVDLEGNALRAQTALGATTHISGDISGTGSILKQDSGTLTLSGDNSFSGTTTVEEGMLEARSNDALGATSSGTTVESGATLGLGGGITSAAEPLTLSGSGVEGTGALLNLDGINTWTGTTTLAADATIGANSNSQLTITGDIAGGGDTLTLVPQSDSTITLGSTTSNPASPIAVISGSGTDVIFAGQGTTAIGYNAGHTYTGSTTIRSGSVLSHSSVGYFGETAFGNSSGSIELGDSGTAATDDIALIFNTATWLGSPTWTQHVVGREIDVNNQGNTITIGATGGATLMLRDEIDLNRDLILFADTNTTVEVNSVGSSYAGAHDGEISGTGDLTKTGTGTLNLRGNNTYSGDLLISEGTVSVASSTDALANSGRVTLADTATALLSIGSNETIGSLAGGGSTGGNVTVANGITLTTGGDNSSTTFSGVVSGSGNVTKSGSGTMTFDGTNSFTGTLILSGGTVALGANNVFANTMNVTLSGGRLTTNGHTDTVGTLTRSSAGFIDFSGIAGSQLTFSSATGSGAITVENWIGSIGGNGDSQFNVTSGSAPGNLGNINFIGWGTGAAVVGGSGDYEIVPTLTGIHRWDDTGSGDLWRTHGNWVGDASDPDSVGAGAYFGIDPSSTSQTVQIGGPGNSVTQHTVGKMILDGNAGHTYSFTSNSTTARRIVFDNGNGNTAYLTVIGGTGHHISSSATNRINIDSPNDRDLTIVNNSTASVGLTHGVDSGTRSTFDIGDDSTIRFTGSGTTVINSVIQGGDSGSSIVKDGAGILRLTQSNTFSGNTVLDDGTIQIANNSAFSSGTLVINGGNLEAFGAARNAANAYTINGDYGVVGSQNLTLSGTGTVSAGTHSVTVSTGIFHILDGNVGGSGGIVKEGDGVLAFLNSGKAFSGGLTVNDGVAGSLYAGPITLGAVDSSNNVVGSGNITVNPDGTFLLIQDGNSAITLRGSSTVANAGGTLAISSPGNDGARDFFIGTDSSNIGTLLSTGGTTAIAVGDDIRVRANSSINVSGGTVNLAPDDAFVTEGTSGNGASIAVSGTGALSIDTTGARSSDNQITIGQYDTVSVTGSTAGATFIGEANSDINLNGRINLWQQGTLTVQQGTTNLNSTAILDGGAISTAGTLLLANDLVINPTAQIINAPNIAFDTAGTAEIRGSQADTNVEGIGTLSIDGGGTVVIDDATINNIDATTIDIRSGTLMIDGSDKIANTTNMQIAGTFNTNDYDEVLGSLTLSGESSIDLGSDLGDGSILRFANSSGTEGNWDSGSTLNIENWRGSPDGGGLDQIYFGSTADGLQAGQLAQIRFIDPFGPGSGIWGAKILPDGEIVPIPEPAAVAAGIGLFLLISWRERKRIQLLFGIGQDSK